MGIETALLVATAAGTAASAYSSMESGRAQRRAYEAEQRRSEIQNVRAVRQQIRQARLAESALTNIGAQTGGIGGSGLAGGIASVGSQLASNINYIDQIAAQNTAITNASIDAATAKSNAALYGSLGQLSGTIFQGYTGLTPGQYVGKQLRSS